MTEHSLTHGTFTLERSYSAPPKRVFAAWADAASKARWFAGPTANGDGTELLLTEHGTYLDGQEQPGMREAGTSAWLDAALTTELRR